MTDTTTEVLIERGKRYDKFTGHAMITQALKRIMRGEMDAENLEALNIYRIQHSIKWERMTPDQCEALDMIAHKIGRILNGDPDYADSWRDIAGYAQLVADRLEGIER